MNLKEYKNTLFEFSRDAITAWRLLPAELKVFAKSLITLFREIGVILFLIVTPFLFIFYPIVVYFYMKHEAKVKRDREEMINCSKNGLRQVRKDV